VASSTLGHQALVASGCRLCVVCDHATLGGVLADDELAHLWAEVPSALIELRLDGYADLTPVAFAHALACLGPKRCVVTFRSREEGGGKAADDSDAQRCAYYTQAFAAGVHAVDTELASLRRHQPLAKLWATGQGSLRVVSAHQLSAAVALTQAALVAQRDAAEAYGADVVKMVVAPRDTMGCLPLLTLLEERRPQGRPLIGLAIGAVGLWSRILAGRWPQPAPWTYARLQQRPEGPLGQPTWQTMVRTYRVADIDGTTPVFGVIGAPVAQSLSPEVHNGWLRQRRLPGVYLPLHVPDAVSDFLQHVAPRLGLRGLSVTHPHKVACLPCCAALSAAARAIGAVNTLLPAPGGTWRGDNTDAAAAVDSVVSAMEQPAAGLRVLLLGAGGVARAAAMGFAAAGAQVSVWARRPAAAAALAAHVGGQVHSVLAGDATFDVVVHCTPVGMASTQGALPFRLDGLRPSCLVFDTIYRPAQTPLLCKARAAGHPTLNGLDMFMRQAAAQFARFTGVTAPVAGGTGTP
jgi:3-dehydroquinate dehydratase/shikimate dehydrogenase